MLVAVVLVAIGLTALMSGLASLTASFRRSMEIETLQRLAHEKYEELVATGDWTLVFEGEFEDDRYEDFEWESETETTDVLDLEYLRVTVTKDGVTGGAAAVAEGLVYRPNTELLVGGTP